MYRIAFDRDLISEEVYKRIRKVKFEEENNKRLRYLSEEEIDRLLNVCKGNLKGIVLIALNAGLRKGEILNLRWDNVDLKNNFFLLDLTKNGARKDVPFNETIKEVLLEQFSKRKLDVPYMYFIMKRPIINLWILRSRFETHSGEPRYMILNSTIYAIPLQAIWL